MNPSIEILCPIASFLGSFFLALFILKRVSNAFLKWMKDID